VYHLELRHFPHTAWSFNLGGAELGAVVEPWVRGEVVELGDRKWSPERATLTILEGPHLPVEQLSMGRGWRSAQRSARDVTERILAAARQRGTAASPTAGAPAEPSPPSQAEPGLLADSLALELLSLLDARPTPLAEAWRLAAARLPGRPASECLALAERAVASLLDRGLIVILAGPEGAAAGSGAAGAPGAKVEHRDAERLLRARESWSGLGEAGEVLLRRL
jgi:hypothetical protein